MNYYEFLKVLSPHGEASFSGQHSASFLRFLRKNIKHSEINGNASAVAKLSSTLSKFTRFLVSANLLSNGDFKFAALTPEVVKKFEWYLKSEMLSMNTISFYMRLLRSYYHKGVEQGLHFSTTDPFKQVYTGIPRTKKRAIDSETIKKITNANLPKRLELSRDLFLFSFYTRGMSFIDVANLKQKNLKGSQIVYYRSKSGKELRIALEPCIKKIIAKYKGVSGSDYLFPIRMYNGKCKSYSTSLRTYNNHLKRLSSIIGLEYPLTSYVSRHSWVSIAKAAGVPILTISEGMGHSSEKTTQIYLTSLSQKTIDDANRYLLSQMKI